MSITFKSTIELFAAYKELTIEIHALKSLLKHSSAEPAWKEALPLLMTSPQFRAPIEEAFRSLEEAILAKASDEEILANLKTTRKIGFQK